jgi:hypothetical protein
VTFFYLFIAEVVGNDSIATWGDGKAANIATCLAFIGLATLIAYRGMTATDFSISWLNPFSVQSFSALATALSLSIFMY